MPEPEPISVEQFLEEVRRLAVNVELPTDATKIDTTFHIMFRYKGKGKFHQVLGKLGIDIELMSR